MEWKKNRREISGWIETGENFRWCWIFASTAREDDRNCKDTTGDPTAPPILPSLSLRYSPRGRERLQKRSCACPVMLLVLPPLPMNRSKKKQTIRRLLFRRRFHVGMPRFDRMANCPWKEGEQQKRKSVSYGEQNQDVEPVELAQISPEADSRGNLRKFTVSFVLEKGHACPLILLDNIFRHLDVYLCIRSFSTNSSSRKKKRFTLMFHLWTKSIVQRVCTW